jgi:hypothetical protein
MNDAGTFLCIILALAFLVAVPWAMALDRRDRQAERSQYTSRLDIFPRKPGCRCQLCKEAAAEYRAAS